MDKTLDLFNSTLSCEDYGELSESQSRVLELMSDRQWHDAIEIRSAAQGSEGLRRLRELRKIGFTVHKRKVAAGGRLYEYRIEKNESTGTACHQCNPLDRCSR